MNLVKRLRQSKGWPQEQLAQAAGVGRATVQRIESGRIRPTLETAQAIAAALDTDAASIRAGAGLVAELRSVMAITNERDATKSELHGLPPAMRRVFIRYYLARAEIAAAEREMQDAGNQHISALQASNHASDICASLSRPGAASQR